MSEFDLNAVTSTVISGLENGADDDTIRMEMFKAGVPFNKINPLFKEIGIEAGFRVDPKIVRDAITDALVDVDLEELTTWENVLAAVATIHGNVEGSTEGQVISALKRAANDAELDFPKKPKGARSAGTSKIKAMIVDTLNADPEADLDALVHAIIAMTGGEYRVRNALEYFNMYVPVMLAAKQNVSLAAVVIPAPDKDALVNQYGGTTSYTATASESSEVVEEAEESDDEMMVA